MLYRTKFVCAVLVVAAGCGEAADSGANLVDPSANVSCEADVCVLSGVLTEDLRLTADKEWILSGGVFVGDDVSETVLTVEPGTTIYGDSSITSFLTIRRGSKLIADGTAEAPIGFTSAKNPGSRARGDWGGLIINGRAPVNNCGTPGDCQAEGGAQGPMAAPTRPTTAASCATCGSSSPEASSAPTTNSTALPFKASAGARPSNMSRRTCLKTTASNSSAARSMPGIS